MTRPRKITCALVCLLSVFLLAAQALLWFGLTGLLQRHALPAVRAALGADVQFGSAAANLFRGSATVRDFRMTGPAESPNSRLLSVGRGDVNLRLLAIPFGLIDLQTLRIRGARLSIARDTTGKVNLTEFAKTASRDTNACVVPPVPAPPLASPGPTSAPPPTVAVKLPRILLEDLLLDAVVEYVDCKDRPAPVRLGFKFRGTACGLRTCVRDGGDWAPFKLEGALDDDPAAFVTRLNGKLAPLTDAARPSFDLDGRVKAIDFKRLAMFVTNLQVSADSGSLGFHLECRDGRFLRAHSLVVARLVNVSLKGDLGRNVKGPVFKDLKVAMPVGGPLSAPEIDYAGAVTLAVLSEIARHPDTAMMLLGAGGAKTEKSIGKTLRKLNGLLGRPAKSDQMKPARTSSTSPGGNSSTNRDGDKY